MRNDFFWQQHRTYNFFCFADPQFPVNFSNEARQTLQQPDKYHQHPQNPLYQGPQGSASFQNTPRLPVSQTKYSLGQNQIGQNQIGQNQTGQSPYGTPAQSYNSGMTRQNMPQNSPQFQGYSFPVSNPVIGQNNQVGQISQNQPSPSDVQNPESGGQDPFAGLSGLRNKQPRHAESLPSYAHGAQLTSLSNPNIWAPTQANQAPTVPQNIGQQSVPSNGMQYTDLHRNYAPSSSGQSIGGHSQPNSARSNFAGNNAFSGYNRQGNDALSFGPNPQQSSPEVKGNALTRPFYPAGTPSSFN